MTNRPVYMFCGVIVLPWNSNGSVTGVSYCMKQEPSFSHGLNSRHIALRGQTTHSTG